MASFLKNVLINVDGRRAAGVNEDHVIGVLKVAYRDLVHEGSKSFA